MKKLLRIAALLSLSVTTNALQTMQKKEMVEINKFFPEKISKILINKQLIYAVKKGDFPGVEQALFNNADVNTKDLDKDTPLHLAMENNPGYKKIIKLLLSQKNILVNSRSCHGTPLILAIQQDKTYAELFINQRNLDLNLTDVWKKAPIHWAVMENDIEILKLLVEAGANLNIIAQSFLYPKKTARDMAQHYGYTDIVNYLDAVHALYTGVTEETKTLIKNESNKNKKTELTSSLIHAFAAYVLTQPSTKGCYEQLEQEDNLEKICAFFRQTDKLANFTTYEKFMATIKKCALPSVVNRLSDKLDQESMGYFKHYHDCNINHLKN